MQKQEEMNVQPRVIFLFSGQGSHYYQMGKEFMGNDPVFTYWMKEGESILADLGYPSFLKVLYENPQSESWADLLFTHPGLVIIEYATFQMLKNLGIKADAVLGASVGEMSAAAVSEFCSFEDAVKTSLKQAELIVQHCPLGGMISVLAPPSLYRGSKDLQEIVHLAGVNFSNHFMISGLSEPLKEAEKILKSLDVAYQTLPLNYPFHCSEIAKAQGAFANYCLTKGIFQSKKSSKISLISGIRSKELKELSDSYFWDVVFEPIPFQHTILEVLEKEEKENLYIDLGPSGTLATFVKYNLKSETSKSRSFPLLTPFHRGGNSLKLLQKVLGSAAKIDCFQ